ncbi:hypothetical protein MPNT_20067 [Candidatus Methylacidithermus pantelleriae]|uniref:Uncharacterized protein n=1 Tax=Candidatus Methylacidithermus pantelleriae TaxID=2744239 RepID=A0A8J2FVW5_9BACT|nr:hypothetical protein MPNT_20067 [Candidatus Methylacidithermus pantelleriae]
MNVSILRILEFYLKGEKQPKREAQAGLCWHTRGARESLPWKQYRLREKFAFTAFFPTANGWDTRLGEKPSANDARETGRKIG